MGSLGWPEILIILVVLVLLFGAKKLPDLARSVGQSARVFKGEMKGLREDGKADETPGAAPTVADPAPLPLVTPMPPAAPVPPTTRSADPTTAHAPGSPTAGQ